MNNKKYSIGIVDSWSENEIVDLYKAGGWWKDSYDKTKLNKLIKGSFIFAVAVDKKSKKAIGMGRVLSDGVSDAYVQDLVVLKKYRNEGIGSELLNFIINECKKKGILWIALIAEPNQNIFYEKNNFKKMRNYIPMKHQIRE